MVVRYLYGCKLAGRYFCMHLSACIDTMVFTSCFAEHDVWMKNSKRGNGKAYYEYVLLYVDDFLVISDDDENVIREEFGKYFELKQESIKPPDLYLGGKMRQVTLDN